MYQFYDFLKDNHAVEDSLVILCINTASNESEYLAYMVESCAGSKPEVVTSDDIDYIEKKMDYLWSKEDFERYTEKCNAIMHEYNPDLKFKIMKKFIAKFKVTGFSEEIEGVTHRPLGQYNRDSYKLED